MIMKKFVAAFGILLLGSFFVFNIVFSANSDIIINEIGASPTSTHEWIEIWNKGSEPVDLIGWKFWENNTNHGLSVSTTDAVVAPGEYAAIVQDDKQFILDNPSFTGSVFDSSWSSLNESGEEIGLKDNAGNFVEQFTYVAAPNHSLERKNPFLADYTSANWQENAMGNTVGAVNSNFSTGSVGATSSQENNTSTNTSSISNSSSSSFLSIKINEFVSNPDSGNEWVELFNPSTSSLNLAGGFICDSRNTTSTCKNISGVIEANGWLKIDLQTDSYLNNDGDTVILKNANGDIADEIVYDADSTPAKGEALARSVDGSGDWAITTEPTPGAANIITAPVVAQPQSSSGGGGGTFVMESPNTSTSSKKTSPASAVKKPKEEKTVGLLWKIKYDPRLRQQAETSFDASKTIDPRGGRISYEWDFENQIIFGANIKYTFTTSGIHVVVVRATSTAGTVDVKKITVMVYPANETAGSGIIFGEILANAGNDEDEHIQLKNITTDMVDISNWKLAYKNNVYQIPTGTLVLADDYLIFYKTVTGFTLNNSGGDLLLLNQDNILMDEINYGKAEPPEKSTSTKKFSGQFFTRIIDARAGQKGDWAKLKGVVEVLPGVFGSQYFYLTDGSTGIQIYQSKKDFPPLEIGDLAQVYGSISEANGIKRINVKNQNDIDILSIGHAVSSTELNADEIDDSLAGGLVQTQGEITEIKSNFMYLDNGSGEVVVYFKQGAKIDKTSLQKGANARVTGVLEQTKTGWQIWPRSSADIENLGPSADLLKQQTLSNAGDTESKYLTATAGGITTLILGFLFRTRGMFLKRAVGVAIGFIKKDKGQG